MRERVGRITNESLLEKLERLVRVFDKIVPLQITPPFEVELIGTWVLGQSRQQGDTGLRFQLHVQHLSDLLDEQTLQFWQLLDWHLDVACGQYRLFGGLAEIHDDDHPIADELYTSL